MFSCKAHASGASSQSDPTATITKTKLCEEDTVAPYRPWKYIDWDSNWDLREKKSSTNASATESSGSVPGKTSSSTNGNHVVHQIVLIRHGQYDMSHKADELRVLTTLGRQQAELTGARLRELLDGHKIYPPKTVYYSTMQRATETYNIIKPYLPAMAQHCLKPCSMITEGAVARPEPPKPRWQPSDESFAKDGLRVEAAFAQYFHRADERETDSYSTVLVCHGNVIRYLVMRALQLPESAWLRTGVYNASITILEIQANGNVSLRCMSDAGHMPPSAITSN